MRATFKILGLAAVVLAGIGLAAQPAYAGGGKKHHHGHHHKHHKHHWHGWGWGIGGFGAGLALGYALNQPSQPQVQYVPVQPTYYYPANPYAPTYYAPAPVPGQVPVGPVIVP